MDPVSNFTILLMISLMLGVTWLYKKYTRAPSKTPVSLEHLAATLPLEDELTVTAEEEVGEVKIVIPSAPKPITIVRAGATAKPPKFQMPYGHDVQPQHGTWDLRALPNESSDSLKRTFEALPFDTALSLLRNLQEPARKNVLRRLPVMPAVKKRLEKALDN